MPRRLMCFGFTLPRNRRFKMPHPSYDKAVREGQKKGSLRDLYEVPHKPLGVPLRHPNKFVSYSTPKDLKEDKIWDSKPKQNRARGKQARKYKK